MKKKCAMCNQEKPLKEYCKCSKASDGLYSYCLRCAAEKRREWRKNNREKNIEINKKWETNNRELFLERRKVAQKKWRENNRELGRKLTKQKEGEYIKTLSDIYIRKLLKKQGLTDRHINECPELVAIKRIEIKGQRSLEAFKNQLLKYINA